jgi:hypothetical protein
MTVIATLLPYAPLLVAVKSGWELYRMVREKRRKRHYFKTEELYLLDILHLAYNIDVVIECHEYKELRKRVIRASKERDRKFSVLLNRKYWLFLTIYN